MSEPDEFDAYDLSEFTEEDFAAIDAHLARAHGGPAVQIALEDSPLRKFLSWKKHLAVTDLVSPLWCEVQYEYGLYGERHKPVYLRPSAFTSRSGKQIRVHQPVAHANDQRLKRGKSVHKVLEDELAPEKIVVHVVSEEERFGLRLLRLIDGFSQLVLDGITRELPVFAITHAQVVFGVIDEVLRVPLPQLVRDQVISPESRSATPSGSPPAKKQRRSPSLARISTPESSTTSGTGRGTEPIISQCPYELRIVDYKTRQSSNVPLDEDSLSSRLQLMMYHRMLSSILQPETFDFDLLWARLGLDPTKPFSPQFAKGIQWDVRRTGPTDCDLHLNCLVYEWIATVQRNRADLKGISQQLQVVYRRSVYAGKGTKGKQKATETVDIDDPLAALALQEELDLARAIEESFRELEYQEVDRVAHYVAQNIKQSDSGQTEPGLARAIQESLLDCAVEARAQVSVNVLQRANTTHDVPSFDQTTSNEQVQETTTLSIPPVIGMKEVRMDDEELDAHIADVLRWWFGARPARGVDIGQTNRCFTCEYRESCEWRERKAKEAVALASGKKRDETTSETDIV